MSVNNFLNFIGPRNVRSSVDKVIAICSGRIQGEFDIPDFRWVSYTHADLGGVSLGRFRVGCSSSVQNLGEVIIPVSKCKRNLAEKIWFDV